MIKADGIKAFRGTMMITPYNGTPFEVTGDWVYRPNNCTWYCGMFSFPEKICVVKEDWTEGLVANPGLESGIAQVKKAPTVDAVPVEKLGNLGKYMMPYTGDPRGSMGMPGIFDPQKDALMMDTFEDVDGSVWRPVLEPVLQELLRRVNAMQVVRCKNCKQYDESETGSDCGLHVCRFHTDMSGGKKALFVEPMDFCSYGERKDDGKV